MARPPKTTEPTKSKDESVNETPQSLQFIIAAGQALYGERWKSAMARDFDMEYGSVNHWINNNMEVPERRVLTAKLMLENRRSVIDNLIENAPLPGNK